MTLCRGDAQAAQAGNTERHGRMLHESGKCCMCCTELVVQIVRRGESRPLDGSVTLPCIHQCECINLDSQ